MCGKSNRHYLAIITMVKLSIHYRGDNQAMKVNQIPPQFSLDIIKFILGIIEKDSK